MVPIFLSGTALAKTATFKFSHFMPPDEPSVLSGQRIEKDLNENAKDLVKYQFLHSGQMGSTIEIIKKVRLGTLQGGFMAANHTPDLSPKFGTGTLTYCMDFYKHEYISD